MRRLGGPIVVLMLILSAGGMLIPDRAEAASSLSLTLVSASGDDFIVAWSRSYDPTFIGYEVYAKPASDPSYGSPVYATTDRDERACMILGYYNSLDQPVYLEPETTYNIFVKNYDNYGASNSNTLTVATTANITASVTLSTGTGTHISWDNPIQYGLSQGYNYSFDHYSIYKREGVAGSYEFADRVDDKSVMSWADSAVVQGQEYSYYVLLWDQITYVSNGTLIDYDLHQSNTVETTVPKLMITSPNSGEQLVAGLRYQIEWDTEGSVATVRIDLLKGGVENATVTTSAINTGSYNWTVRNNQTIGSDYGIRVQSTDGTDVSDETDAPLSITGSLTLTNLEENERLVAGTTEDIRWTSTGAGLGYLSLDLYKNGSFSRSITPGTVDDGSFEWSIPENMTLGSDYKIRIVSTSHPSVCCESSSSFSIGGQIAVLAPTRDDEWAVGATQTITWNSTGAIGSVTIELCDSSGVVQVIASDAPNTGTYSWKIPGSVVPGEGYFIKITGRDDALASDSSGGRFSVSKRRTSEIMGVPTVLFVGVGVAAITLVAVAAILILRRSKARLPPIPPESPPQPPELPT